MFCPECGKDCPDSSRFCGNCGFAIHKITSYGEKSTDRSKDLAQESIGGGVKIGDVGMIKDSQISSTTNIEKTEHHGAPAVGGKQVINVGVESKHVTKTGERCAICGSLVKDDYFRCKGCGRDFLCRRHQDEHTYLCVDCVAVEKVKDSVHCPICGFLVKDDYFKCKQCGRTHLCSKHYDSEYRSCEECSDKVREENARLDAERKRQAEEELKKGYICPLTSMEFVYVNGGTFQMGDVFGDGSSSEQPVHEVCVDDFYIGKFLLTFDEYDRYCEDTGVVKPSDAGWGRGRRPVIDVSWEDAQGYIEWINKRTGKQYRLPTEAEWEYAARSGGKKQKWSGISSEAELGSYAWYDENSNDMTHPIGQKEPNGLGIYDMSGNVWEWVNDRFGESYYRNSPRNNPKGPDSGGARVLRGGSWIKVPWYVRSSYRNWSTPDNRHNKIGFRVALPPQD